MEMYWLRAITWYSNFNSDICIGPFDTYQSAKDFDNSNSEKFDWRVEEIHIDGETSVCVENKEGSKIAHYSKGSCSRVKSFNVKTDFNFREVYESEDIDLCVDCFCRFLSYFL